MDPRTDIEGLKMTDVDDENAQDAGVEEEDKAFEEEPHKGGRDTERELDHGLKETFPASDPVSINPGAD